MTAVVQVMAAETCDPTRSGQGGDTSTAALSYAILIPRVPTVDGGDQTGRERATRGHATPDDPAVPLGGEIESAQPDRQSWGGIAREAVLEYSTPRPVFI